VILDPALRRRGHDAVANDAHVEARSAHVDRDDIRAHRRGRGFAARCAGRDRSRCYGLIAGGSANLNARIARLSVDALYPHQHACERLNDQLCRALEGLPDRFNILFLASGVRKHTLGAGHHPRLGILHDSAHLAGEGLAA